MDDNKMACVCFHLTIGDLREAVENGAKSYEEVISRTKATIACGLCAPLIQKYVTQLLLEAGRQDHTP